MSRGRLVFDWPKEVTQSMPHTIPRVLGHRVTLTSHNTAVGFGTRDYRVVAFERAGRGRMKLRRID